MSEHSAAINWERGDVAFTYEGFSRAHTWRFPNGIELPASSAPQFNGDADRVDPESALVVAVSSCHMLTFLAVAARKRLVVDRYEDDAVGRLEKNDEGRLAITHVTLRPKVTFSGDAVSDEQLEKLHALAHKNCFIANSLKCQVTIE